MNAKATAIISYLCPLGWVIAYLAGDREGAKFHLNQSLVLAVAEIIGGVIIGVVGGIPIVGWIISGAWSLIVLIFWIMGFISAVKFEEKPLPVIGGIQLLK